MPSHTGTDPRPSRRSVLFLSAAVAVTLALLAVALPAPASGAESRRDAATERTPVVVQIATPNLPDPATVEPDSVDAFAAETGEEEPADERDPAPDPVPSNIACPEDWVQPTALNDDIACIPGTAAGGGGALHPGHTGCPDGYRLELLLQQEADGSLWWSYGCIPIGGDPTGPDDVTTGRGGTQPDHDTCPDGWVPAANPALGCIPDRAGNAPCPDGSAIHPYYPEYGCIPFGQGPWAP